MSPPPPPPPSCPTWTDIPIVCCASPLLPFTIYSSFRSQEKPLRIYVLSLHSQVCHLKSPHLQLRLKGQFFPGPEPHVLAMFLPLHLKCSPLSLSSSLFHCRGQGPTRACYSPRTFILAGSYWDGCVRHLPHNTRMVPTASKSNCTPSCPHLSPDMSHHESPGRGTFAVFIHPQH